MKEKKNLVKVIVYALLLLAMLGIGFGVKLFDVQELKKVFTFDGTTLVKLLIMVVSILLLENLLLFVLQLVKPKKHRTGSVLSLICSLIKYAAFIAVICFGLTILGVNITTIIASIGILALIVGFSAESLIADIVTGTFMLLENQYNVGDIVEVNGFRGVVTSIGIRTTCITDSGDNVKIINNSEMKNILNRSDNFSKSVCDIAIPYETDLEKFEEKLPGLLKEIYEKHEDVFKGMPVYLGVQALEESDVLLRFVAPVTEKNVFAANRILNHDLLLGFRKLGVECPYPQVDVHNR